MSIAGYIITLLGAAMTLMALIMVLFVNIFSNVAVEYDIKSDIEKEVRKNLKYVTLENGTLTFLEGFAFQEESYYFVLLNQSGEIIEGEYPEGFPADVKIEYYRTRSIKNLEGTYYFRDMRNVGQLGKNIVMRGVVRKEDVDSRYETMEYVACGSILVIYFLVIGCGLFMSKRISNSMKKMCQTAENIGRDLNISQRMEYEGPFYELEVLAQANNRMLDRIEYMFHQQEQFTSDVAHELRTPIAVSMAQCQYAKERMDNRGELEMAFDVIYRQAQKVNKIISQLLHLSRLDQGSIQKEEIDLVEIVQAVCEDEQDKAGDTISIRMNLKDACSVGDINLISIAVLNLVTNAVKFSKEHGIVEVETGKESDMVYVLVRDYGKGIAKEEQEHIFERFYKVDKSRNSEGFGLGLALTKKIAEVHGGDVTVSSELEKGSTFQLLLPVKK